MRASAIAVLDQSDKIPSSTLSLVILDYQGSQKAAVLGMFDLLSAANRHHQDMSGKVSLAIGAFLLAQLGILDDRPATTHWALAQVFADSFPDVRVDSNKLVIDDGDIISAGGLMAWVDLCLHLIGRFLGPTTLLETARLFLVDPDGREQRFYRVFSPRILTAVVARR